MHINRCYALKRSNPFEKQRTLMFSNIITVMIIIIFKNKFRNHLMKTHKRKRNIAHLSLRHTFSLPIHISCTRINSKSHLKPGTELTKIIVVFIHEYHRHCPVFLPVLDLLRFTSVSTGVHRVISTY